MNDGIPAHNTDTGAEGQPSRHFFRSALRFDWRIFFTALFACLLIGSAFVAWAQYNAYRAEIKAADREADRAVAAFTHALRHEVHKTDILKWWLVATGEENMRRMLEDKSGQVGKKHFLDLASELCDNTAIRAIELLPAGVINYMFPETKNMQARGADMFAHPWFRKVAETSRDRGTTIVQGPHELVQGGQALIVWNPIFFDSGEFWGFSMIVLDLPAVLWPAELLNFSEAGYVYELTYEDPEKGTVVIDSTMPEKRGHTENFDVYCYDRRWNLAVAPARGWFSPREVAAYISVMFCVSLCLSLLIAFFLGTRSNAFYLMSYSRKAMNDLEDARSKVAAAGVARSVFLAQMCRELRQPAEDVMRMTKAAADGIENRDYASMCLNKAMYSGRLMMNILDDMLDSRSRGKDI